MSKVINNFGGWGSSGNMYHGGREVDFRRFWNDAWDDGEEPPHHDHQWRSVDEFSADDEPTNNA